MYYSSGVNESVDRSNTVYTEALSETCLIKQLCNCRDDLFIWSFTLCTVNCRPTASNYQLSHLRSGRSPNPDLRGRRQECYQFWDENMHWCFVHNNISTEHMLSVNKNNNFGFISRTSIPTPLFLPSQVIESDNLIEWAFMAHQVVATSNCLNYKSARIKVPTELNINNWRSLCGKYEGQFLLDYLELGFPLLTLMHTFKK